jgi:hypothetical protein
MIRCLLGHYTASTAATTAAPPHDEVEAKDGYRVRSISGEHLKR